MPRKQASSAEAEKPKYCRRGFWLKEENQFWNKNEIYSVAYRYRMNALVLTLDHPNRLILDLIKTK